jgi:glycosyltransferase involved in cell wall biosynthesis
MQRLVDRLLASETYEAAYVHLFRMAPYVVDHPGIYRIVDLTDVISQEIAGSLPYRSMPSRFLYRFEQPRIASYERQVAGWAEEAWLISERDKSILTETCPQANLKVVPIGVDLDHYHLAPQMEMAHNLLFVGHLGVFHNIDAVTFLVEQILPIVRQDVPDCILTIIGAGLSSKISELERYPGVKVLGFVPDLNRALNGTAVFVAPLRFSAGVQTKVLEAMAAGVPVVTTSSVNAGLAAQPDQEVLVGDGAPELASQVIKLLRDDLFRSQLGRAGRRFVEQRFSWQVAAGRLNQVEQLLSQKGDTVI